MIENDDNRKVGVSEEGDKMINTYYVQFVCFFGIPESIMYVVESNQMLFCVTFLDLFVHSTSMVNDM